MWKARRRLAFNIGLDYRGPRNWFAGVNFNYYDNIYLSMNPMYRTATAIKYYTNVLTSNTATNAQKASALSSTRRPSASRRSLTAAYTLSANIGKNWYIHRGLHAGLQPRGEEHPQRSGHPHGRLRADAPMSKVPRRGRRADLPAASDSKYFYLFGTTYYLNVYFRF